MEWNLCLISKTKPKLSLDILTRTAKFQKIENYKLCPDMNLLELPYITGDVILCTEKAMASHSSTFAWKIPWTEEPGGLQSMGSPRVRHDWATEHLGGWSIIGRSLWAPGHHLMGRLLTSLNIQKREGPWEYCTHLRLWLIQAWETLWASLTPRPQSNAVNPSGLGSGQNHLRMSWWPVLGTAGLHPYPGGT